MSYDYILFRPKEAVASYRDISDKHLSSLGTTETVKNWLRDAHPSIQWATTAGQLWGVLHIDGTSLEIILGDATQQEILSISIKTSFRTESRQAIQGIADILGLTGMDMQTCELIRPQSTIQPD